MKVMIAGAGSVGRSIARDMVSRGHVVHIVDRSSSAMRVASVPQAEWILGDACDLSVLEQVGLGDTDVVVTATGDDKANLVVSLLAKSEFGVPRVVSRINNPANEWLFDRSWGVDVPVSTPNIMSALIEDAVSAGTFVHKMSISGTALRLYQGRVAGNAPVVGSAIDEVAVPSNVTISAIIRDGQALAPDRDVVVDAGDHVLVLVRDGDQSTLETINSLIAPASAPDPEEEAN